ncbi:MAG: hypothetical protein RJA26_287 [Actinomycetota bacterium]|jgi:hypothetical protein
MVELRLESSDGEYLVLESPDGNSYRLLIDEGLRKAVRRESVSPDDSNRISPRDIQLEVRAGVSIDELATKTGASLEYLEKFAAPVIDELAHVVKSALSVRITMAGDRYNETTQVEFGEVIANRLATNGVVQQTWSARKSDNHGWQIHCTYGDNQATWAFDPRKLALAPENELAVQLSTQQSLTDGPIPRLRPVIGGAEAVTSPATAKVDEPTFANPVPHIEAVTDEPFEPVQENEQGDAEILSFTRDLADTVALEVVASDEAGTSPNAGSDTADLTNTADLLDALRKRRIEREREAFDEPEIEPVTIAVDPEPEYDSFLDETAVQEMAPDYSDVAYEAEPEYVATETAPIAAVEDDLSEVHAGADESEKPKKPGRSSMPSWDEIVFNTRHDD